MTQKVLMEMIIFHLTLMSNFVRDDRLGRLKEGGWLASRTKTGSRYVTPSGDRWHHTYTEEVAADTAGRETRISFSQTLFPTLWLSQSADVHCALVLQSEGGVMMMKMMCTCQRFKITCESGAGSGLKIRLSFHAFCLRVSFLFQLLFEDKTCCILCRRAFCLETAAVGPTLKCGAAGINCQRSTDGGCQMRIHHDGRDTRHWLFPAFRFGSLPTPCHLGCWVTCYQLPS
jgi:hypothetical protein